MNEDNQTLNINLKSNILQKILFYRFKAEQLRIRVGSNSALAGGKLFTVDCLYPHPMHSQFNNDLALLKTSEDMVNNSTVQMIAIGTNTPELGTPANFVLWNTVSTFTFLLRYLPSSSQWPKPESFGVITRWKNLLI